MKLMKTRISLEKKDIRKIQEGIAFLIERLECAEYALGKNVREIEKEKLYQQIYNYQSKFQDWMIENLGSC